MKNIKKMGEYMDCKILKIGNKRYVEIVEPITCESGVIDIIGISMSNDIDLLLFREEVFTDEFINLKTGLAGIVLQKLSNYHIKVVALIENEKIIKGRFKELLTELSKSNYFRVFNNFNDVENWILKL